MGKYIWNMTNTAAIAKFHKYCVWPMTIGWLPDTSKSISWSWCAHENVMAFHSKVFQLCKLRLVLRTCPAFCRLQYGEVREGLVSFLTRDDIRIERLVERVWLCAGALGPEQQTVPSYQVTYNTYLANRRLLNTPSVECVVSWTKLETQPVISAKFCHFLITSCSDEKRYQALATFPYCKRRKAEWDAIIPYSTHNCLCPPTHVVVIKTSIGGHTILKKWIGNHWPVLLYMELLSLYSKFYGMHVIVLE